MPVRLASHPFTSSLRAKLLIFVFLVSAAFSIGTYALQRFIVNPEFERIERRESESDLSRVREAIARDGESLARNALDYAAWNDTLAFVRHQNPSYVDDNLIPEMLTNVGTDLAVIQGPTGEILFANGLAPSGTEFEAIPAIVDLLLSDAAPIFHHDRPDSRRSGLVRTPQGILLVGAAAITNNEKDVPASGTFLFGRFLGPAEIESLAERTRVSLSLLPFDAIPESDRAAALAIEGGEESWFDSSDPATLVAYGELRDVADRPIVLLRVELPRPTSKQARSAAFVTQLASIGGSAVLLGAMWVVLARLFVKPLERVTAHAVRVGANADLGARIGLESRDEIGTLAREFDAMVARLETSRAELLEMARRDGRAQIARMILHDIGNVLNSVRVGTAVVTETFARSELANLRRLVGLLRENADRLPEFLTADTRGRHVLPFLDELTTTLEGEQGHALAELKALDAGIEHMSALVRSQNGEANAKPVLETIDPLALADQAAALTMESFARHGIRFERSTRAMAHCWLDRHRCLQILANLLTNAKNAISDTGRGHGRIAIVVEATEDQEGAWLDYTVEDDGIGIHASAIEQIFVLGHSSHPGGQGIGLHSAANLAREMNGRLSASSPGPGLGARFTLRLPRNGAPT